MMNSRDDRKNGHITTAEDTKTWKDYNRATKTSHQKRDKVPMCIILTQHCLFWPTDCGETTLQTSVGIYLILLFLSCRSSLRTHCWISWLSSQIERNRSNRSNRSTGQPLFISNLASEQFSCAKSVKSAIGW